MSRITRYPPKPTPRYEHEVRVGISATKQGWLDESLERIAGARGYKVRQPFWSYLIVSFVEKEQAHEFARIVRRHEDFQRRLEAHWRPCPNRARYEEAARRQHAIIWGLSTGAIREVVRIYRRERSDCSTHGMPSWVAADAILAVAPTIARECAREMVNAMLAYVIARHGAWFWSGLQGDQIINRY